jgi:hypothetical protein
MRRTSADISGRPLMAPASSCRARPGGRGRRPSTGRVRGEPCRCVGRVLPSAPISPAGRLAV